MALTLTPICEFGWKAPNFDLEGIDGKRHSLDTVRGPKGTLVMFLSNHCPYVQAILPRLVQETFELEKLGISSIAIMSNDTDRYPEDSFDQMKIFAKRNDFGFPYVIDPAQEVARAYDAVCTPDFFGFNASDELQYRGRLDESKMELIPDARRDLFLAMSEVAETGHGPQDQKASMGCSIKWK